MTSDESRNVLTEVSRDVAADPISTALLLTSAEALEWWPGLRVERGAAELGLVVPAILTAGRSAESVDIEALPPRRTPTAFVASFRVTGGSYGPTEGAVTLARQPAGTRATVQLDSPRGDLEPSARRFLSRLAKAAEGRASAA